MLIYYYMHIRIEDQILCLCTKALLLLSFLEIFPLSASIHLDPDSHFLMKVKWGK